MDECLNLKPVRIPRPQIYTHIDLAIMEKAEKVGFTGLNLKSAKKNASENVVC